MSEYGSGKRELGSIRTEILVAYIFAILVTVSWIAVFLFFFGFYFVYLGFLVGSYIGAFYLGFGLIYSIIFLVLMIPSILVMRRTGRMYRAVKKKNIEELKKLNSVGWAIVALIFTGIISGIMLLIAHGPIEELSTGDALSSSENLDRLVKLKSLLDSGIITKEEFDKQKSSVLHPESTAAAKSPEEDLKKLKALLDSGTISQAEYEDQKKVILSKMMSK